MEVEARLEKVATSTLTKNKKLRGILDAADDFKALISAYAEKNVSKPGNGPITKIEDGKKLVEGRDIDVCVRVRPLLAYEEKLGFFTPILASHPHLHALEPRLDVRGKPKSEIRDATVFIFC